MTVECPECGQEFQDHQKLAEHILEKHHRLGEDITAFLRKSFQELGISFYHVCWCDTVITDIDFIKLACKLAAHLAQHPSMLAHFASALLRTPKE